MENVIVTTLKEKVKELNRQLYGKRAEILKTFIAHFEQLLISIDPIFTGWTVQINDYCFEIKKIVDSYHRTALEVKFKYTHENGTFNRKYHDNPNVSWSSCNATEEYELQTGIMIGIMCQIQRTNNTQFQNLILLFKQYHQTLDSMDEKKLYEDIAVMEKQIRDIESSEKNKTVNDIFNKGSMEFIQKIRYKTGNGKHDYMYIDNVQWEIKPGQKTGKLTTILHRGLEQEYKYTIKERMPIEQIESFISSYMNSKN